MNEAIRGDDWGIEIPVTEGGVALNLTGATLTATIAGQRGVRWSSTASAPTPANGIVLINVPKEESANFMPGECLGTLVVVKDGLRRSVPFTLTVLATVAE